VRTMKKLIASLICAVSLFVLTTSISVAAVEKIGPNTILLSDMVYMSDFKEFLVATETDKWDGPVKHWNFIIHSRGGCAFTTVAIMNRMAEMQNNGIKFTTTIYGAGMSAGTYIWLMGDERIVHEGATLMFHSMIAQLGEYQRQSLQESDPVKYNMLERVDGYIADRLRDVGWTESAIEHWMEGGKMQFMSAETAYNIGLATKYVSVNK
jgi:ATP-dependent protease ClpP protease subunit